MSTMIAEYYLYALLCTVVYAVAADGPDFIHNSTCSVPGVSTSHIDHGSWPPEK